MPTDWWTVVGTVLGAVSLALAAVQTVRYRGAKRLLLRLNEREQLANWALYDLVVQAYDNIGEARSSLRPSSGTPVEAIEKTAQVAALLNAMWLQVVQHAAMLEPNFNSQTIDRWSAAGRLDTDWRKKRARKLLPEVGTTIADVSNS